MSRGQNICLIALTFMAGTASLVTARAVLLPFILALFAYAISLPVLKWLQNKVRIPKVFAVLIIVLTVVSFFMLLLAFLTTSVENFFNEASIYKERLTELLNKTSFFLNKWDVHLNIDTLKQEINQLPFLQILKQLTGGLFGILGNLFLVLIFYLFLLAGIKKTASNPLLTEIQKNISTYVSIKCLISLATGLLVGIVLWFCQIELAFMFAILTIFFNFIPSLGSIIATLLPLPIVFLQYGFSWPLYTFILLATAIQLILGQVLEPKFLGDSMDLHPATLLLGLMFWGFVLGFAGMFIAAPLTVILKIIFSRIEATRPLSELMAGRI